MIDNGYYHDMELQIARVEYMLSGKKGKAICIESNSLMSNENRIISNERRNNNIKSIQSIAKTTKKRNII